MQYMIMNYVPPAPIGPDGAPGYGSDMALREAYTKALIDADAMRGGSASNCLRR